MSNFTLFLNQCEKFRSNMVNEQLSNTELGVELGSLIELCASINSNRNDEVCTKFLIRSFHASTYTLKCTLLLIMNLDIHSLCYDSNYEPYVCAIFDGIIKYFSSFNPATLHTEMTPQLLGLYKKTLEVYGRQPTLYDSEILNMLPLISRYKHSAVYGKESLRVLSYSIASIFDEYVMRSSTTAYIDADVILPILKDITSDRLVDTRTVAIIIANIINLDEIELTNEELVDCSNKIWNVLQSSQYDTKITNLCTRVLANMNVLTEPLIEQTVIGALYIKFKLYGGWGYQICI